MGRPLRGGVWTNVEDEVLKSAIMKYGTNQWARVASLINRKSASQCKARWYEWLSPMVKKTEWTQEENEKLLHLAKVFPTQWRTISDMIGRTPNQCHQQYVLMTEKMNSQKEGLGDINLRQDDSIDIRPESRPAKPDSVDMAEDEIDMLNEARARLANTQGKKAKRKGRERQLIMARRLAAVQQKRELNEVGINANRVMMTKKKPGVNYNEEIPFYQPVPRGFYDSSKEVLNVEEKVIGKRVSELEFESREDREKRERKKDADLKRKMEDENLPEVLKNATNQNTQIKRSKLILSEPKLGGEEFQDLIKMGKDKDTYLNSQLQRGNEDTNLLISSYMRENEDIVTAEPTPMTASVRQKMEIENLKAIHNVQTPLLGGENVPLHDIRALDGRKKAGETGNTFLRASLLGTPATESSYATPNLGVDKEGLKYNMQHKKTLVKNNLGQLPTPEDVALFEKPELPLTGSKYKTRNDEVPLDQEDLDKIEEENKKKAEAAFFAKRSTVIKRNLPRPIEVNHTVLRPANQTNEAQLTELQKADEMVKQEMIKMLHYDLWKNPVDIEANGRYVSLMKNDKRNLIETLNKKNSEYSYIENEINDLSLSEIEEADKLLKAEIDVVKQEIEHQSAPFTFDAYCKVWEECYSQLLYLPKEKRYTRAGLVQKKDRIECMKHLLDLYSQQYSVLMQQSKKKEDKMTTLLNGYMARSVLLQKAINDVFDNVEKSAIELKSLESMQVQEKAAIARRVEYLERDVERQKLRENQLQSRYAELIKKKQELEEKRKI